MRKLIIKTLLLLTILGSLYAQSILDRVITLRTDDYELPVLLKELKTIHDIPVSYGSLPVSKRIYFSKTSLSINEILTTALHKTNFTYQLLSDKILIVKKSNDNNSGSKSTIKGYVRDSQSGEALIGASIYDHLSGSGVVANNYGFYSLTLPSGRVEVSVSFLGFTPINQTIFLNRDTTINWNLVEEKQQLEDVTVYGTTIERIDQSPQMGSMSLSPKEIESVPAILGERDVLKAIQLLPGIHGGAEGTSGVYVRGGGPDQNLFLLDGVPVYNTAHLFGFFSVFNSDAINHVEVIKGGFPARYGGRLSSVIDLTMKEGNNQVLKGKGTVGLISSKFIIEGPIKNEQTSFIASGRRTYLDLLAYPTDITDENNYYFYDFNAKINHRFSEKDRVFLSFYGGHDEYFMFDESEYYSDTVYRETTGSGLDWGNIISVLRWNHVFNNKLFGAFSGSYSKFRFNTYDERYSSVTEQMESLFYASGIQDYSIKANLEYQASPQYLLRFGGFGTLHAFNTGVVDITSVQNIESEDTEDYNAIEWAGFVENDLTVGKNLRFNLGIHYSRFDGEEGSRYHSVQPRFSGRYLIGDRLSLKASYSEMQQYIHLLTNSGIGLPTDLWVPATKNVKPQFSRQSAIGAAKVLDGFEVSLEAYYKTMENLIEYENGASYLSTNTQWENKVESGDGKSYGVELLIKKNSGRLTGWIGYTLSKTTRQFENLNFGKEFNFKYDRRHDLSLTGKYKVRKNFSLSANWVFGTGNNTSLPITKYVSLNQKKTIGFGGEQGEYDEFIANYFNNIIYNFNERNNYRMRSYHRLDLSLSWSKKKKRGTRTWSAGVYNAYNRLNAFFVYIDDFPMNQDPQLKQTSLLPAIPFINYSLKF